jgi:hypothetical protein
MRPWVPSEGVVADIVLGFRTFLGLGSLKVISCFELVSVPEPEDRGDQRLSQSLYVDGRNRGTEIKISWALARYARTGLVAATRLPFTAFRSASQCKI